MTPASTRALAAGGCDIAFPRRRGLQILKNWWDVDQRRILGWEGMPGPCIGKGTEDTGWTEPPGKAVWVEDLGDAGWSEGQDSTDWADDQCGADQAGSHGGAGRVGSPLA